MKKAIIILIALACILTLGAGKAAAGASSLYAANTVTPMVLPLSGHPDKFKVTFFGVLTTSAFDGYLFPLPSDWNGEQQQMDSDCEGCAFEIIAENSSGPLVGAGSTVGFSVTSNGFFGGRWEQLSQSDATPDLTFKVRYTGVFGLYGPFVIDSEEFAICDIAGASSHIDICKPVLDESIPDPTSPTQDTDGDGWMNATETLCGSDYLVATSVPDDHDDDDLCDVQDPDDDNDGWSDTAEIDCGTSPYNSSEVPVDVDEDMICDVRDDDISTPGDDGILDADGDGAGILAPPPPSSNTNFSGGNCSLNPGATARTAWPILLMLTCFTMPIVLNLRTKKRK